MKWIQAADGTLVNLALVTKICVHCAPFDEELFEVVAHFSHKWQAVLLTGNDEQCGRYMKDLMELLAARGFDEQPEW